MARGEQGVGGRASFGLTVFPRPRHRVIASSDKAGKGGGLDGL